MIRLAYFFFYTYVGLVIVAGFWGAFLNPSWDFRVMFSIDLEELAPDSTINLLSQYRFLRALELGFGLVSIMFVGRIFSDTDYRKLFLLVMGLGILARVFSWGFDGNPNLLTKFFLFYEAIGWVIIWKAGLNKVQKIAADGN
jgi:hypothetical protein